MSRGDWAGDDRDDCKEALDDKAMELEAPSQPPPAESDAEYDPQIGEAFRRGDQEAFRVILARFGPMIQNIVRWYAPDDRDARAGLYQEVCIRIWKKHSKYEEQGKMRGWLSTLAHRHARNYTGQRGSYDAAVDRFRAEHIPSENMSALLTSPERVLRYQGFVDRLQGALGNLPDRQAKTFGLVIGQGCTPAEAAKELGVSPATVRSNLRLVRAKLRALLSDFKDEMS